MSVITVNPNVTDINNAIKSGASVISIKAGTILFDIGMPQIFVSKSNVILDFTSGVVLRAVLRPQVWPIDVYHIVAMNVLGYPNNDYLTLSSAQKTAVANLTPKPDVTVATNKINSYLATLPIVKDSRMWDVKPTKIGHVTYNGINYVFPVRWHSPIGKGIITGAQNIWGTLVRGGTFQNARMDGSSNNAAGVRTQSPADLWVESATFQDCDDGCLAGGGTIVNPTGEWYDDSPPNRMDFFGHNVDKDCFYDNCGSPQTGLAHGFYGNDCLYNVSIRPTVVRPNAGHGRKFHGGLQVCVEGTFLDPGDSGGYEQCIDMDGGAGYVINSKMVKVVPGNYGAPLMMRNGREPIPPKFENVLVAKGNDITYMPIHVSNFINSLNEPAFVYGWPGVPLSIRTDIESNVFRAPLNSPIRSTPVNAPVGSAISNNIIIGPDDSTASPKIPISNYAFSRESLVTDVLDLVSKVDPGAKFLPWLQSHPLYPAGV